MNLNIPNNYTVNKNYLYYKDINLTELAKTHNTPLRVHDPAMLGKNFSFLKEVVQHVLKSEGIEASKYECGYAIKANQHKRLVSEGIRHTDFIEASSYNDLCILEKELARNKSKYIVCHGFKTNDTPFFNKIIQLAEDGYAIVPITDSVHELNAFAERNTPLEIGIRITSPVKKDNHFINERFGITVEEIDTCLDILNNSNNLRLTTLHMHVANTILDIQKRIQQYDTIFSNYMRLLDHGHPIQKLNIGGGLPTRSAAGDEFFATYFKLLVKSLISHLSSIDTFPTLQNESGRFLVEETQFLILKVLIEKKNNADFSWYVLNGSAINLLPEIHIDSSKVFEIIPTDGYASKEKLQKVKCAGITCDPEDYFSHSESTLPALSSFSGFLTIPNTGAYQESLLGSARSYPGHCLIDQPIELVLDSGNIEQYNSEPNLLKTLGYHGNES